jgi:hypothetical protein
MDSSDGMIMLNKYHEYVPDEPCLIIGTGDSYDVDIDITYEIDIGDVATEKHSIGRVHVTGIGGGDISAECGGGPGIPP